jgi:hypothetical protein
MTPEYLVLGIVLLLMGAIQIWLRHGPGARAATSDGDGAGEGTGKPAYSRDGRIRSGRAWDAWTAILGFLGVALGIALVVLGALGK